MNFDVQPVFVNVPLAKLRYHAQIIRVNIHKRYFNAMEFRHGKQIRQKPAGKANAARPDKCDFE